MKKETLGQIAIMVSILAIAATFGGNLFDIIVNESNTTIDFPNNLIKLREVWAHSNPGNFFKVLTPIYGLSTILALALFWKQKRSIKVYIFLSLFFVAATQLITVIYFFPQNEIIRTGTAQQIINIKQAYLSTRQLLDNLRMVLTFFSIVCSFIALHLSYEK